VHRENLPERGKSDRAGSLVAVMGLAEGTFAGVPLRRCLSTLWISPEPLWALSIGGKQVNAGHIGDKGTSR
jgi:hypothetical protein